MRTPALPLAVCAAALAAAGAIDLQLAGARLSRPYDVMHVPDARAARIAALGHRHLVSTLYWLSAVQYIGDPHAEERGWDKLHPLADLVTDLDPRHGYAYQTAGIVLSAYGRLDESDRILLKGIEKGPPWWSFPYYVSFNHWFYRGDYAKGAEYARMAAARNPGSEGIRQLAVSLSSKSGTPEEALRVLEQVRATVQDEVSAKAIEEQMKLAVLERDAQALERASARFQAERGRWPADLDELVRAGFVAALPADPFGGRYVRDRDGRVRSSANAFRFELHEGPHAPAGFQYEVPERDLRRMPQ
jgi:tetratricopeptide (TPR) repeat protein